MKICHNFNKSASVYSEMLSFRCFDFLFKTKGKKCSRVLAWTLYENVFVPLSEDFKRKGPFKDRIITMIVIIITKIGIDSTGKHNLH